MSDLLRQRALVQAELNRLDSLIAEEPDAYTALIRTHMQDNPGLKPADVLYASLNAKASRAGLPSRGRAMGRLLAALGYVRVKKEQGVFWS